MMRTLLGFTTLCAVSAMLGCGEHRAPQPIGDPDMPRVGWIIMHGHKDNPDEEFGRQSNPRTDCSVHASTANGQTLSEVHLYFHPTKTDTTYTGVARIGFFQGAATSSTMTIKSTVMPGDVGNHSVVGIVTDKPGRVHAVTRHHGGEKGWE